MYKLKGEVMNNASKQKLGKRLLAVVVSVLATIAVMAVGVYAAQESFSIQVQNEVDIAISKVDGVFSARRGGDMIYTGTNRVADTQSLIGVGKHDNGSYIRTDSSGNFLIIS